MNDHPHIDKVTALCERLGSAPDQARIMAGQLLKRAGQMAGERRCTEAEALDYLLRVTIAGRNGEVLAEKPPGSDPEDP